MLYLCSTQVNPNEGFEVSCASPAEPLSHHPAHLPLYIKSLPGIWEPLTNTSMGRPVLPLNQRRNTHTNMSLSHHTVSHYFAAVVNLMHQKSTYVSYVHERLQCYCELHRKSGVREAGTESQTHPDTHSSHRGIHSPDSFNR